MNGAVVAVNVTTVPESKFADDAVQPVPHRMPPGELLTAPPSPFRVTLSRKCSIAKLAVTDRATSVVTVHD